jgi:hypothetical protein
MNLRRLLPAPIVAVVVIVFSAVLGGCASMEAHSKESRLAAAGFKSRVPETANQKAIVAAMKPDKLQRRTVGGKVLYAYYDPKENLAYVGTQAEYDAYKKLAVQQDIAEENELAAVETEQATDWGAWGPWGFWY